MRRPTRTAKVAAVALVALAVASAGGADTADSVTCSSTVRPADAFGRPIDLTGHWEASDGTYTLRQIGSCLWWVGRETNVFFGTIFGSSVSGVWADVSTGASGRLTLLIRSNTSLSRRASTGRFPAVRWKKR